MVRAFAFPRTAKFLATRDVDGIPNVVPVLSLEAVDERTIIFGELMIWKTRRNLDADARVSILALTEDLCGWAVRGRFVEFQRTGAYYDRIMEGPRMRYNPYTGVRSAGVIEVLGASPAFRFSRAGLLIDALRSRWLARRLPGGGRKPGVMPAPVQEKFGRLNAAKAVAYLDAGGHPECLPALAMMPAGPSGLVWGGFGGEGLSGPEPAARIAAAVITMEPVAYQVKGTFRGWRQSFGRRLGAIDVLEAFSASPPLPGYPLPSATRS